MGSCQPGGLQMLLGSAVPPNQLLSIPLYRLMGNGNPKTLGAEVPGSFSGKKVEWSGARILEAHRALAPRLSSYNSAAVWVPRTVRGCIPLHGLSLALHSFSPRISKILDHIPNGNEKYQNPPQSKIIFLCTALCRVAS